jgi:hypothetical protein
LDENGMMIMYGEMEMAEKTVPKYFNIIYGNPTGKI